MIAPWQGTEPIPDQWSTSEYRLTGRGPLHPRVKRARRCGGGRTEWAQVWVNAFPLHLQIAIESGADTKAPHSSRETAELNLGWLAPLHMAIPELPAAALTAAFAAAEQPVRPPKSEEPEENQGLGRMDSNHDKRNQNSSWSNPPESSRDLVSVHNARDGTRGPPLPRLAAAIDPVESALAEAITRAAHDRRWDVVAQLARELEARRLASADNVIPIRAARERGGR